MQFSINVLASGSRGNAVIYDEKILVDIGTPYSKLKKYLDDVKLILLTHRHFDHLNTTTLRKIIVNHKDIRFGVPHYLVHEFEEKEISKDRYQVYEVGELYNYGTYKIAPIKLYHDVPNVGYRIIRNDGYKHIHITDTYTVQGIIAKDYDSAAIECNFEKYRALELINEADESGDYSHIRGSINSHLSVQDANKFIDSNNIKRTIPLHISSKMKKEVLEYLELKKKIQTGKIKIKTNVGYVAESKFQGYVTNVSWESASIYDNIKDQYMIDKLEYELQQKGLNPLKMPTTKGRS